MHFVCFQVGAVIIHPQKDVVSTGFNHMPNDSEKYSWTGEGNWLDTKYPYGKYCAFNNNYSSAIFT